MLNTWSEIELRSMKCFMYSLKKSRRLLMLTSFWSHLITCLSHSDKYGWRLRKHDTHRIVRKPVICVTTYLAQYMSLAFASTGSRLTGRLFFCSPTIELQKSPSIFSLSIGDRLSFLSVTPFLIKVGSMPNRSLRVSRIFVTNAADHDTRGIRTRRVVHVFSWDVLSSRSQHDGILVLFMPLPLSASHPYFLARHVLAINWVIYVTANHSILSIKYRAVIGRYMFWQ